MSKSPTSFEQFQEVVNQEDTAYAAMMDRQLNLRDFFALKDSERTHFYDMFLLEHPTHPDNIDNGQDFDSTLAYDQEFTEWYAKQ